MLSNAYFLAKFRFHTAENEPAKKLQNFRKMHLHHPFIRVLRSTERRVRRPVEAEVRGPLLARRRGLAGQLPAQRRDERALPDLPPLP